MFAVGRHKDSRKTLIDEIIEHIIQSSLTEKETFSFPAIKLPGSIFLKGVKSGKTMTSGPPGSAPKTPRLVLKGFKRRKRTSQKNTEGKHWKKLNECFPWHSNSDAHMSQRHQQALWIWWICPLKILPNIIEICLT